MTIMVCYARCWPCTFGEHYDPPKAHTWMDDEDYDHAVNAKQIEPGIDLVKEGPCSCACAKEEVPDE